MYYKLFTFYLYILFKSSKSLPSIAPPFVLVLSHSCIANKGIFKCYEIEWIYNTLKSDSEVIKSSSKIYFASWVFIVSISKYSLNY